MHVEALHEPQRTSCRALRVFVVVDRRRTPARRSATTTISLFAAVAEFGSRVVRRVFARAKSIHFVPRIQTHLVPHCTTTTTPTPTKTSRII